MKNYTKLLLISFITLSTYFLNAQTLKMETVTFNLGSNDFETALPFDIEFKIQGVAPANVKKIIFQYKTKTATKNDLFEGDKGYTKEEVWENVTGTDTKFSLPAGPLRPNITYEFKFTYLYLIEMKADQKAKLNEDMAQILKGSLYQIGIKMPDIEAATQSLQKRIKTEFKGSGKITDINNNEVNIVATDPSLHPINNKITEVSGEVFNAEQNIKTNSTKVLEIFDTITIDKQLLTIINTTNTIVSPITKNILEGILNPTIKGFETAKTKEVALVVVNAISNRNTLKDIIEGRAKITGNLIEESKKIDLPSIQILLSFFRTIYNPSFANDKNVPIFSGRKELGKIINNLQQINKNLQVKESSEKELTTLKEVMPDLLRDKLISENYKLYEQPAVDVMSEKNPYIGLDAGLIYVPAFDGFFVSQGVNFYFYPVNKKVPLRNLPCRYTLRKMFSLYLGVTQKASGATDENYKPLFNDAGSLLYGCGLRVNRVCRVGVGGILFQYKNANPAFNKYDMRTSVMFSFSFDIDIIKSLGDFAKFVGLNK